MNILLIVLQIVLVVLWYAIPAWAAVSAWLIFLPLIIVAFVWVFIVLIFGIVFGVAYRNTR